MNLIFQINYLLKKKEKTHFLFLLLCLFFVVGVDIFSFSLIIPAFQIIFLNKFPQFLFIDFSRYEQINFLQEDFKQIFLIIFVLFFIIKNVFIIYFELIFLEFFKKVNIRISSELFQNYISQDYIYFLKNSSKNILQKVTSDVDKFTLFSVSLMHFLIDTLFLIGISILLMKINFYFFLICLANFAFFIFIYLNFFNQRIKLWSNTYREAFGKNQNLVIEGLKAFKDLIIYNQKDNYISKFVQNRFAENHSSMRITFLSHIQKSWLEIVGIIIFLIIIFYLIIIKFEPLEAIPILTLFTAVLFRILISLSRILANFALLKYHSPSAKSLISDFKECNNYKKERFSNDSEFMFNNNVEVRNLSFSYDNNKNLILKNISFRVNKGDLVGVLGPNGSGKTTLINLTSGFLKPTSGTIIIDNKYELYKNRHQWFKSIACVQQNIFLWDTTIKNNIILSNASYNDIKFNYLKNLLNLDQCFDNLPDRLDTMIGQDGIKISGGQKQLISIARALYKEADILIFDEPTTYLDEKKIIEIRDIILNLKKKKTIFIVTHDKDLFYKHFDFVVEVNN